MKPSTVLSGSVSIFPLLRKVKTIDENVPPEEVVKLAMECPAIRPQQVITEFVELATLVKKQRCKYILEIGTYRGGTLFVFSQLAASDSTLISIDFSMTFLGNFYRLGQKPVFRKLIRKGQSLFMFRKDSHKDKTLEIVRKTLQGHKLDFLFIDGDHSYDGVRMDFEMYSPLLRSGGLIAFHDIVKSEGPEEVHRFWNEVKQKYSHQELIHSNGGKSMGIGALWV